jgi:hypothetical protein
MMEHLAAHPALARRYMLLVEQTETAQTLVA